MRRNVVRALLRPVPYAIGLALFVTFGRGSDVDASAASRNTALVSTLASRGFACTDSDIAWIAGASGVSGAIVGSARALVRANTRGEPSDLYFVDARLSPEGTLLEVGSVYNLTKTSGVDESRPMVRGSLAAYSTAVDGLVTGIHTIDLAGRAPAQYTDFTRLQRWQTAATNVQQTGQDSGIVHNAFALDPVASDVAMQWRDDHTLAVVADGRGIVIDAPSGALVEGAGWARAVPENKARPGNLVTWAVDRVRSFEWFGEERMQWIKYIAFTGLDWVVNVRAKIFGDSSAKDIAEDLGSLNNGIVKPTFTDPEIGWPPPPIEPFLKPALPGEGAWIALDHDPFITQNPGAPPAFVTSFIRSDAHRPGTRIYVTLWDPRQIALHMEAGTVEPVSAAGEAGPGVIPRTPEVLRRVVAGFNGGFQAIHGEFGMQANGIQYLPPKPYAATVMEMRDGSTAFGSWPENADVPDEILSYRQNLTALVEKDKFNPWGRTWWGGTPKGWADNIHTTRSGICLTKGDYVGYFFGVDISAEVLAQGMLLAHCKYGVHLDMNPGLAGFEFYNVQPASNWKPLGRPIQADWEYEGTVRELPDFRVRARRMIKGMMQMNFPQYIHRDARDFFYLTARPVLPGAELVSDDGDHAPWRVKSLPQHGFPYAIALATLHGNIRAMRLDPRTLQTAGSAGTSEDTPTIVSFLGTQRPRGAELGAWLVGNVFLIAAQAPAKDALSIAAGVPFGSSGSENARAAVGVHDEDGMLDWLELPPDVKPSAEASRAFDAILTRAGCSSRMLILGDPRALVGGTLDITGEPTKDAVGSAVRLVRGKAPGAHSFFDATPIVSPNVWQPLESQRVRYFRRAAPKSANDAGAPAASGSAASSAAPAPSAPSSAAPPSSSGAPAASGATP